MMNEKAMIYDKEKKKTNTMKQKMNIPTLYKICQLITITDIELNN